MRNLFTHLLLLNGVSSWYCPGIVLCATPNKGTTPHTPHPIRRALRLAAMVTLLLTLACGNAWGVRDRKSVV